VHKNGFTVDEGRWVCVELHAKLNPDPATGAGAVLEVFKNDANVMRLDDSGRSATGSATSSARRGQTAPSAPTSGTRK